MNDETLHDAHTWKSLGGVPQTDRWGWPALFASGVRTTWKRKLALLLLFLGPALWMVYFSNLVAMQYLVMEGRTPIGQEGLMGRMFGTMIRKTAQDPGLAAKAHVARFFMFARLFGLVLVAWIGSGAFCEDRRKGAHTLWFSRPLTRSGYVFGKFLSVFFYGALALVVPSMLVVLTAVTASPDGEFLQEHPSAIWATLGLGLLVTTTWTFLTLVASVIFPRRSLAMVGIFGLTLIPTALSRVVASTTGDRSWWALSPMTCLTRLSVDWLDLSWRWVLPLDPALALGALIATWGLCLAIIMRRVRSYESIT